MKVNFIPLRIMVPHKAVKKHDASVDDFNPNTKIVLDTTPRITDTIKS